jgi:hypothetical protein
MVRAGERAASDPYLLSWSWLRLRYEDMLTDNVLALPPKGSFGGELMAV